MVNNQVPSQITVQALLKRIDTLDLGLSFTEAIWQVM